MNYFSSLMLVLCCLFDHSHKKRKDSLKGTLDRVLLAAELEFPKILVPRLPQHISNVNTECAGKSEWSKQLCSLYLTSSLEHCICMFLIGDPLCKLCNIWLFLCENNSRSITIPELNTGGKYCCSYYSRQGDR